MSGSVEMLGLAEQKARVVELGLEADTFQPPHASDGNPFRVMPGGVRFKGYHHQADCPKCGSYGQEKGTVDDYLGGTAGDDLAVYLCDTCLAVWVASFGYSLDKQYPQGHIHHEENRLP